MKNLIKAVVAGALLTTAMCGVSMAAGKTIAVSWKTFQEERWKTDEAAIKAAVEAAGDKYISTDAQGSAQKQAADIEGLISQKPDVIMVVAFDSDAILPSIKAINDAGIKAIAYDVQFEDPNALYITFDNVGVGRLMAKTMLEKGKSEGNFAFIITKDKKVERRDVKVGDVSDAGITILSGLSGNEQVVLTAGAFLNPGETVVPIRQKSN